MRILVKVHALRQDSVITTTCTNEALKPGQLQSAHVLFCCGFPAHGVSPLVCPFALQERVRTCCPFPHVLEQSFHGLQRDHLTSSRGQAKMGMFRLLTISRVPDQKYSLYCDIIYTFYGHFYVIFT